MWPVCLRLLIPHKETRKNKITLQQVSQTVQSQPANIRVGLCWRIECKTGTFWMTGRDTAFKPGLSRLIRDVWHAYAKLYCWQPVLAKLEHFHWSTWLNQILMQAETGATHESEACLNYWQFALNRIFDHEESSEILLSTHVKCFTLLLSVQKFTVVYIAKRVIIISGIRIPLWRNTRKVSRDYLPSQGFSIKMTRVFSYLAS